MKQNIHDLYILAYENKCYYWTTYVIQNEAKYSRPVDSGIWKLKCIRMYKKEMYHVYTTDNGQQMYTKVKRNIHNM